MILIEILLCMLAVALLVPVTVLFIQVLGAMPAHRPRAMPQGRRPAVAVVVPAHNEALLIVHTLRSILPQLAAGDRLLVVADNCTDDTAGLAAAAGAEVIERNDNEHRGKGYALDFAVRYLKHNPPEMLLIVDGDCELAADAITRLATISVETGRPVQALYLMHAPPGSSLKTHIAEFAFVVKNKVRPLGCHRLGLPCQLMGTGMAFPWPVIAIAELASGHIVEDLKLGIDLARAGTPPLFCPDALVTSDFPPSVDGIASQRTRWEHGHLGIIFSLAPQTVFQAVRRGDSRLMALALDLCVPPLALLLMLVLGICVAGVLFYATSGREPPMWLAATSLALLCLSVLLSWGRHGRRVISFAHLAYAPIYALGKIPVYLKFLVGRQVEWVRSKRDIH